MKITGYVFNLLLILICMQTAHAGNIRFETETDRNVFLKNKTQTVYLRVMLTGIDVEKSVKRPATNVAIVLDRSGSMRGAKLEQAKMAASSAIKMLNQNDYLSLVAYDDRINILSHSARVSKANYLLERIKQLEAGGSTAIYPALTEAVNELKKHTDSKLINRVVLLSDGKANVGETRIPEFIALAKNLAKQGISVTTIGLGLGYNEDLMSELANHSDGNHAFVRDNDDLVAIFNKEFGDIFSVAARDVVLQVKFVPGVTPKRIIGRDADIVKQQVTAHMNQVYTGHERYILIEAELDKEFDASQIADIEVNYTSLKDGAKVTDKSVASIKLSTSESEVESSVNKPVMTSVVRQLANERNNEALKLRDAGKVQQAKEAMNSNALYLRQNITRYGLTELHAQEQETTGNAEKLDGEQWQSTRKQMKSTDLKTKKQSTY